MIVLDLPEMELIFDESGHVVDAQSEDDAFTHTMIEMFMVAANEAAARLFDLLEVNMPPRMVPFPALPAAPSLPAVPAIPQKTMFPAPRALHTPAVPRVHLEFGRQVLATQLRDLRGEGSNVTVELERLHNDIPE